MAKQSDNSGKEQVLTRVEARLVIGPGMRIVVCIKNGLVYAAIADGTHPGTGPVSLHIADYDQNNDPRRKRIVVEETIEIDAKFVEEAVKEA